MLKNKAISIGVMIDLAAITAAIINKTAAIFTVVDVPLRADDFMPIFRTIMILLIC
jgi:hypothetical protein